MDETPQDSKTCDYGVQSAVDQIWEQFLYFSGLFAVKVTSLTPMSIFLNGDSFRVC